MACNEEHKSASEGTGKRDGTRGVGWGEDHTMVATWCHNATIQCDLILYLKGGGPREGPFVGSFDQEIVLVQKGRKSSEKPTRRHDS